MAFDRTKSVVSVPRYDTDKVIGSYSGTIEVAAAPPGGSSSATAVHTTGFNESCLFAGIFSTDAGATWNDFGANTPDLTGGFLVLQTVDCTATCSVEGIITITVRNWYNNYAGYSNPKTVLYKLVLLAKPGQGSINPLPVNNIPLIHSSRFNYQKIHMEGTTTVTVPAGGNVAQANINHNLGYIPNTRAWILQSTNTIGQLIFEPQIKIDETNMAIYADDTFGGSGISYTVIYRIYLDG